MDIDLQTDVLLQLIKLSSKLHTDLAHAKLDVLRTMFKEDIKELDRILKQYRDAIR